MIYGEEGESGKWKEVARGFILTYSKNENLQYCVALSVHSKEGLFSSGLPNCTMIGT